CHSVPIAPPSRLRGKSILPRPGPVRWWPLLAAVQQFLRTLVQTSAFWSNAPSNIRNGKRQACSQGGRHASSGAPLFVRITTACDLALVAPHDFAGSPWSSPPHRLYCL